MKKYKIVILIVSAIIVLAAVVGVSYFIATAEPAGNQSSPNSTTPSVPCSDSDPGCMVEKKPIIYLYPEQETEISVTLGHPENLTTTYPKYDNGWQVLASPDGDLTDLKTGRSLYGLYWEGANYPAQIHDTGFVIKGADTVQFLEEKLSTIGLTEREANEFIIYWLPKLEHNPYNYVYFETGEKLDEYMPLQIIPRPDSIIRIVMEYLPLTEKAEVKEQTLPTPARAGFTAVEWGGSLITGTDALK